MYFIYSVITATGMFLLAPYFLFRGLRERKYLHNLPERLGLRFPPALMNGLQPAQMNGAPRTIWIHAVSVGEVLAALPFARLVADRFPGRRLVISTTTATGQAIARERMAFADGVFYFPLDWRGPVDRVLRVVRPEIIIIFETEIWPNVLREARRAKVPVVFVNGRMSERSFRSYSRALRLSGGLMRKFLQRILADAKVFLMQSEMDAQRLIRLGAPAERVEIAGNMKYDMALPERGGLVDWLASELARSRRSPVLVAGSVVAGEERAVLEGFAQVLRSCPEALLVLAPRKPERFTDAAKFVRAAGYHVVRRSAVSTDTPFDGLLARRPGEPESVLLLDTIGELSSVYSIADAVFIGGSLEPVGGHNPLEPALFAKVPLFGPSMENFRDIAARLIERGAAIEVRSGAELGAAWTSLLADPQKREQMGRASQQVVEENRGATAASVARIAKFLVETEVRS